MKAYLLIKILSLAFVFVCFSCYTPQKKENEFHEKAFVIEYTLIRKVVTASDIYEKIIANGTILSSEKYTQNENERTTYIRERNRCLIVPKNYPSIVLLDTSNAKTYLCAEPALDWFVLNEVIKNYPKQNITSNHSQITKLYVGEKARALDSIYVFSRTNNAFPDSIFFIGKQINKQTVSERQFICDVLKISRIDSVTEYTPIKIDEFLNRDSIKNRTKIDLNKLQFAQ